MSKPESRSLPLGFWLLPAANEHDRLSRIIEQLARRFHAPPFEPHVTLHVGSREPEEDIGAIMDRVGAATAPIALKVSGTGHSQMLFKTLFLDFVFDSRPAALGSALRASLRDKTEYQVNPHLSLLYKLLPEDQRRELAFEVDWKGQILLFDQIAAVRPAAGEADWSNIRGWDAWQRHRLTGMGR